MDLKYVSTRGDKEKLTASLAIIRGIAKDGGLYVPEHMPEAKIQGNRIPYHETVPYGFYRKGT